MSDDNDDRAKRLSQRRQRQHEAAEQSEQEEPSDTSEASKPSKQSETDGSSVKDEMVGTYMYLPESLKQDIDRYYSKISGEYEFEYDQDFEKNRHYFQLIVKHGFGAVRDADIEEIREMIQDLEEQ